MDSEAEFGVLFHRIISDRYNLPFPKSTREDEDDTSRKFLSSRKTYSIGGRWRIGYQRVRTVNFARDTQMLLVAATGHRLISSQPRDTELSFAVKTIQVSQFQPISALGHLWV